MPRSLMDAVNFMYASMVSCGSAELGLARIALVVVDQQCVLHVVYLLSWANLTLSAHTTLGRPRFRHQRAKPYAPSIEAGDSSPYPWSMSEYRAPLRDIKFVLDHSWTSTSLSELPAFAHVDPELVAGLLDEAGRFMTEVVAPTNPIGDTVGTLRNDDGTVDRSSRVHQGLRAVRRRRVGRGQGHR